MTAHPHWTDEEAFWETLDAKDRDTRIDVDVEALLRHASEQHVNISIQNLSIHGVRATSYSPPFVGEAIELELAGLGRFQGVVRWQHGNKFGIHTFEGIDLSVFSDLEE